MGFSAFIDVRWFTEACLVLASVFLVSIMLVTAKPTPLKKVTDRKRKLNEFVITCVMFALFTRALWLYGKSRKGVYEFGYAQTLFTVGRISLMSFCIAFISVALEWATLYRKMRHKDTRCLRRFIIAACIMLITSQMLYIILGWSNKSFADSDNLWYAIDYQYNIDFMAMIVFFFLTSSLFSFYGVKITRQLKTASENIKGKKRREMEITLQKVTLVSSVCSICFGVRCICALIMSITYIYKIGPSGFISFDKAVYPTLYYTAPEIIPSLTLVYVLLGFHGVDPTELSTRSKMLGSTDEEDDEEDDEDDEEIRTLDGPTRKHKKESKSHIQHDPFMTRFNDTRNGGLDFTVVKEAVTHHSENSYSSL